MSRVTLIECQPRLPDGTVQTLRLVDRSPRGAAYLGAQWLPYVAELPAFESSIGFDGQRFGAAPSPQIGALAFALAPEIRSCAGWVWRDAPVTIREAAWPINGGNPADGAFSVAQVCDAVSIAVNDGVARVELIDRGQKLRVPLATLKFGTTGIALLDAAAAARDRQAGQVVPVAFGRVFTLPGLLVDRVNNIWLFAASAASSVQAFYDGGAPWAIGAARASLAALQANAPAAGTVDYCLSAGGLFLARPADRPTYPFTADATFGSAALGEVASAIVAGRLPFRTGVVAALNGLGLGDTGLYVDSEATAAEALDRLLAGLGIWWKVRGDGTIDARRIGDGALAASFAAHQRGAPARLRVILPTARRQLGYATNNRVHGEGEIARILLAENLAYADGTPIEALKPAQAGANVTAPGSANRVRDPLFRRRFAEWGQLFNPSSLDYNRDVFELGGQRYYGTTAAATAGGQSFAVGSLPGAFRLAPDGERVSVQFRLGRGGPAGGTWSAQMWGVPVAGGAEVLVWAASGGARGLFDPPVQAMVDIPAGYRSGRFDFYMTSASAGDMTIDFNAVMVAGVAPGQTIHPEFAEVLDGQAGADVTAQQPVVSRLDPLTGQSTSRRIVTQIIASGVIQLLDVNPISATTDGGGVATISIAAHQVLDDAGSLSFSAASISGLAASKLYYVYEDNPNYQGGARTYVATTTRNDLTAAGRRFVGAVTTPAAGGSATGSGGGAGGGPPGTWEFEP